MMQSFGDFVLAASTIGAKCAYWVAPLPARLPEPLFELESWIAGTPYEWPWIAYAEGYVRWRWGAGTLARLATGHCAPQVWWFR